jgi:hypothetical protein
MNKILIFILLSFLLVIQSEAKPNAGLKYNTDGKFKIVQFTDTHIDLIDGDNLEAFEIIKEVLNAEKPDVVILTGDIVSQDDPQKAFRTLSDIFVSFHIPWAVVFGNHESEHNLQRKPLADFLQTLPLCLNNDRGDIHGNSNFILPVYSKDKKPGALLYCMDSNTYSTLKPTIEGYGWLEFSQVEWYRKNSAAFTKAHDGKPLPALAFFHIPLPEYIQAWNNKNPKPIGVKNEVECSPEINTGMFAAMLSCGDVMGTFVGHDHTNDYIGVYGGLALAYGRVSKIMRDPLKDPMAGGRVIVLTEGLRQFDTWIREKGGKQVLECRWPDTFKQIRTK